MRIIEANGQYLVELQVFGARVRHNLTQACFPAFSVGVASLEVCASPTFQNGKLKGLAMKVKLCIGARIDNVNLKKCFRLFDGKIAFFHVSEFDDSAAVGRVESESFLLNVQETGDEYVYVEASASDEVLGVFEGDFRHEEFRAGFGATS